MDVSNYKTIIFDFGGVIGSDSDRWEDEYRKVVEESGLTAEKLHELYNKHWPKLSIGAELASTFWDEVYELAPKKPIRGTLEKYYEDGVRGNKDVLLIAAKLREKGFKIGVITNTAVDWVDIKMRKFGLKDIFNGVYCSCTVGVAKPDPRIYLTAIQNMKTTVRETIFVDDREENLVACEKLGIKGLLFRDAAQLRLDLSELLGVDLQ